MSKFEHQFAILICAANSQKRLDAGDRLWCASGPGFPQS